MALQHLRSSTANKRPVPGNMSEGQLAMNTASGSPGLFFKDSNANLVKVGPVHVGTTAPNASPASGGTAGNSVGEQWLDTSGTNPVLKVWDGSAWISQSGEFVNASGDVMTGALGIIAGSAGSPGLYFSGDTNTGVYSPGADQVAISTSGTGKLFVDNAGGVDVSSTSARLYITTAGTNTAIATLRNASYYYNINLDGSTGGLTFYNGSERLRITSTGELKHIGGGSEGSPGVYFAGSAPSNSLYVQATTGRVGLGSSSPSYKLTVSNTGGSNAGITLLGNDQANARIRIDNGGSGGRNWELTAGLTGANNSYFSIYDQTASDSRFVISDTGAVGIGTTSPITTLHVDGTGAQYLRISSSTYSNFVQTFAGNGSTGVEYKSVYRFVDTDNGERASIDSSGRLLVGTSSQSGGSLLQVNDNRIRIATAKTPASATDTGVAGEICWDADYVYVCTATNTWKRTAISTW